MKSYIEIPLTQGFIALIDGQRLADLADGRDPLGIARSDAGQEQQVATQPPRHVVADRHDRSIGPSDLNPRELL